MTSLSKKLAENAGIFEIRGKFYAWRKIWLPCKKSPHYLSQPNKNEEKKLSLLLTSYGRSSY
jgi:hypothetical protein